MISKCDNCLHRNGLMCFHTKRVLFNANGDFIGMRHDSGQFFCIENKYQYFEPRQEVNSLTVEQIEEVIREQSQIHELMLGSQRIEDMTTAIYDLVNAALPPNQSARITELGAMVEGLNQEVAMREDQCDMLEALVKDKAHQLQSQRDNLLEEINHAIEALHDCNYSASNDSHNARRVHEALATLEAIKEASDA